MNVNNLNSTKIKLKTTAKEKIVEEEQKLFAPLEQVGTKHHF